MEKVVPDSFTLSFTFYNPLTTKLPNPLSLHNYEVALVYASLPSRFNNLPSTELVIRTEDVKVPLKLPAGFYANPEILVQTINTLIQSESIKLNYDSVGHTVTVNIASPRSSIQFSPLLANLFRLPRGTLKQTTTSIMPIIFNYSDSFFLTANFTEPRYFNARKMPILAVSPGNDYIGYTHPVYVPVKSGVLQHITINILSSQMRQVHFLNGAVTVSLHFRRRS